MNWQTSSMIAPLLLMVLSGCDQSNRLGGQAAATIEGTATYRERIALPPGAELVVELRDVSLMDVPAVVLATVRVNAAKGGPPYAFTLGYDPAKIDPARRYALHARIEHEGQLLFVTDSAYPAFPELPGELLLTRVAQGTDPAAGLADDGLTERRWELVRIDGRPAGSGEDGRAPYLKLRVTDERVHGFSGCNSYGGGYSLNGESLAFSQLFASQKACAQGMELETRFLNALIDVAAFSLDGDSLVLLDAHGRELLRFELRAEPVEEDAVGDADRAAS